MELMPDSDFDIQPFYLRVGSVATCGLRNQRAAALIVGKILFIEGLNCANSIVSIIKML